MNVSLIKKIFQHNKLPFVIALLATLLASLVDTMVAYVLKIALDMVVSGNVNYILLIEASLSTIMLYFFMGYIFMKSYLVFKTKAMVNLRNEFVDRILDKRIYDMQGDNQGIYISAVNYDIETIEDEYIYSFLKIWSYITKIIFCSVAMIVLSYQMSCLIIVISILAGLIIKKLNKIYVEQRRKESDVASGFFVMMKEILSGFSIIKSYKIESVIKDKVHEKSLNFEKTKTKAMGSIQWNEIVITMLMLISMLITFCFGAVLSSKGIITIGTVTAIAQLMSTVFSSITPLVNHLSKYSGSRVIIAKLEGMISEIEEEEDGGKTDFNEAIELKNVNFGYDEITMILKDVNFRFEKNKSYAIVGVSGSGKSTLMKLLNGYFRNYQGSIQIDGVEMKDLSSVELGRMVSEIQQDTFIFDDTIQNNLTLYGEYKEEEIRDVIEKISMLDFISEKGLDYLCGENGVNLSGGQKQRISIGRALLRNTSIFLLDEVTSALDLVMAYNIESLILSLKNVTKIVITHKLEKKILEQYDEILLIRNGTILEHGKFNELIQKCGYFYSMYNTYE